MKNIRNFTVNTVNITSRGNILNYVIEGDDGARCHLHVIDNSSPVKFYNFKTRAFTTTFTSENDLRIELLSNSFSSAISIPSNSSGNNYVLLLIPNKHYETQIQDGRLGLLSHSVGQPADVTVRFSTFSDQADANFAGIGAFIGSTSGSANEFKTVNVELSEDISDTGDGLQLGYKYSFDISESKRAFLEDELQPIDLDFFTKLTKETNGSGSSVTSMILNDIDNLVVGMSLVDIESGSVTTSGSLGVLTYPTITAIDSTNKTVTLSSAHSWADAKDITFRAYGSELISLSTGLLANFTLKVIPKGTDGTTINGGGSITVNGDQSGTSIPIDGIRGVSVGSKVYGPGIDPTSGGNAVTAVHASGTPITFAASQTLADNTILSVFGSSVYANISGQMLITRFPSISTDIFYDIDRAFILATNS